MRERFRTYPFTMGYDTEFCLRGPSKMNVPAYMVISDPKKKNNVGLDGTTDIGELRGFVSNKTADIAYNIGHIMRHEMPDAAKMHEIIGGAYPAGNGVGFHFHYGIRQSNKISTILSNFLGFLSILTEPKPDGERRRKETEYGKMKDFRDQDYGGFEYRTFYSFTHDPKITEMFLTFGAFLMYFVSPIQIGGLDGNFYLDSKEVWFNTNDVVRIKEFYLDSLLSELPLLEKNENFQNRYKEKTGNTEPFLFTEQEIEAMEFIQNLIAHDWSYPADKDWRKGWSKPNEPVEFIYSPRWNLSTIKTGASLNPVYIRSTNKSTDSILLSGFSTRGADILSSFILQNGMSVSNLRFAKSAFRCCPTININPQRVNNMSQLLANIENIINGENLCAG